MFPHQKLDWNIRRLDKRIEEAPDDAAARIDHAVACLSRAWFHDGGEIWFNRALTGARRILQVDPASPRALVIAGVCLVHLARPEQGAHYLDEALKLEPERADVRLGLAAMHTQTGDRRQAIRELEMACRLAPERWEPHFLLGRELSAYAEEVGGQKRLLERSQFHIVKALSLDPAAPVVPALLHDLGVSCLSGGRWNEAHKIFQRLLDHEKYRSKARYYLGIVLYNMGKYKNAIVFLRQHLEQQPENPHVYARIGMAYLNLGELEKSREACNRALAIEPGDLSARWTLGSALLEEGQTDEAVRVFKEMLQDAPDHLDAFRELVSLRSAVSDERWLRQALRAEVSVYDRLPMHSTRDATGSTPLPYGPPLRDRRRTPTIRVMPRATTRERILVVLEALSKLESDEVPTIVEAMDLVTDEGLRFLLWDAALNLMSGRRARDLAQRLRSPGTGFSTVAGREALILASVLPEPLLTRGLQVTEEDLKRAAVDRNPPARDVQAHRANVERERQEARAWQALLLLAVATRPTRSGRNLLVRWASDADPDLADASRAALAMLGDTGAAEKLRARVKSRGAETLLAELVAAITAPQARPRPQPVTDEDSNLQCKTCGRRAHEVDHLLAGGDAAICDACLMTAARERREHLTDDPSVACALCGRTSLETRGVYVLKGTPVCSECIDQSLGLVEREEVDRFLATW